MEIALGDGSAIEVERDHETQLVNLKFRMRCKDDGTRSTTGRNVSAMMARLMDDQRDALVAALSDA